LFFGKLEMLTDTFMVIQAIESLTLCFFPPKEAEACVTDYSRVQPELQYSSHPKEHSSSSGRTTELYPSHGGTVTNPASRHQGPSFSEGFLSGAGGFSTGHTDNRSDLAHKEESDSRLREGAAAELCSLKKTSGSYSR
jgi:hypothetical protein